MLENGYNLSILFLDKDYIELSLNDSRIVLYGSDKNDKIVHYENL